MLSPTITEEVRKLSPSERLALIEYTSSLLRDDIGAEESLQVNKLETAQSFIRSLAEAGEDAIKNGAPELPCDFATNHDKYLYGNGAK